MGENSPKILVSAATYAVLYPQLVEVAKSKGYALAIHGSMTRDFDLIAVPWVKEAATPLELALAIRNAARAVFYGSASDRVIMKHAPKTFLIKREHGRLAAVIHLTDSGCYGPYIDLSIMPPKEG